MEIQFPTPRFFLIWFYTAEHGTLLIRSLREQNADSGKRVQIFFTTTHETSLPTNFQADRIVITGGISENRIDDAPKSMTIERVDFNYGDLFIGYIKAEYIDYAIDGGTINSQSDSANINGLLKLDGDYVSS